jgi:hypothetical protein
MSRSRQPEQLSGLCSEFWSENNIQCGIQSTHTWFAKLNTCTCISATCICAEKFAVLQCSVVIWGKLIVWRSNLAGKYNVHTYVQLIIPYYINFNYKEKRATRLQINGIHIKHINVLLFNQSYLKKIIFKLNLLQNDSKSENFAKF